MWFNSTACRRVTLAAPRSIFSVSLPGNITVARMIGFAAEIKQSTIRIKEPLQTLVTARNRTCGGMFQMPVRLMGTVSKSEKRVQHYGFVTAERGKHWIVLKKRVLF